MLQLTHFETHCDDFRNLGAMLTLTSQYQAIRGCRNLDKVKALITYSFPLCMSLISTFVKQFSSRISIEIDRLIARQVC